MVGKDEYVQEVKAGEKVQVKYEITDSNYEFAYWYLPTGVEIKHEDVGDYFIMPNVDCLIGGKSQEIGKTREKKKFRFELKVINGGSPASYDRDDYYNEGDKILCGIRPNDSIYGELKWSSSTNETFDYPTIIMPNHDIIITVEYSKK